MMITKQERDLLHKWVKYLMKRYREELPKRGFGLAITYMWLAAELHKALEEE